LALPRLEFLISVDFKHDNGPTVVVASIQSTVAASVRPNFVVNTMPAQVFVKTMLAVAEAVD
jgi:hypothetical protein